MRFFFKERQFARMCLVYSSLNSHDSNEAVKEKKWISQISRELFEVFQTLVNINKSSIERSSCQKLLFFINDRNPININPQSNEEFN